jgi:hypothetical protein
MKNKAQLFVVTVLLFSFGASACASRDARSQQQTNHSNHSASLRSQANAAKKPRIPAFQTAESAKNLPATLSPDLFQGSVRSAYAAVREIPEIIAQLPCFCHCDRSFGHKSLHTCFVDDHGADCGVCSNSALLAYRLHKEQKLNPEQIREKIIAEYSPRSMQHH